MEDGGGRDQKSLHIKEGDKGLERRMTGTSRPPPFPSPPVILEGADGWTLK